MMQMSQSCNPRIFVSGCLYSLSTPPLALNLWSDLERSESLLARDESMEGTTEEINRADSFFTRTSSFSCMRFKTLSRHLRYFRAVQRKQNC